MHVDQWTTTYLDRLAEARMKPVGIVLDRSFRLQGISGNGALYGLDQLSVGDDLREHFPFLDAHPPGTLANPEVVEFLEMGDHHACHVHYFVADAQRILFLFDAREDFERQFQWQQQANELDLLTRKQSQLMAALEQARNDLEHADRMKGRFIAGMSHEYRIPLTSVLGHLDRLRSECPQAEDHVTAAERSTRHLLSLINNVLDQAQISEEKLVLTPVPTCLRSLLDDVEAVFAPIADDKGLTLRLGVSDSVPEQLELDGLRLRQVVINLLGNAVKFTDKGTVALDVYWAESQLKLVVEDTGPGISESAQQTLFAPFSRDKASAGDKPGTGLGLAISAGLVKLMGGDMQLESALGEGSRFNLELPAAEVSSSEALTLNDAQPGGHVVLMIEDDADVLNLMSLYLGEAGFQVVAELDPTQALAKARQHRPDCIVVDMEMPELKGDEVSRLLRDEGIQEPIVVMSALSGADDLRRAMESGANSYLIKPVEPTYLIASIAKLIQKRYGETLRG